MVCTQRWIRCDICNRSFSNCSCLKLNVQTHTGEKNHRYKVCDMTFGDANDMKNMPVNIPVTIIEKE